jgi:uncharacterized membrane protein YjjB (DUF3815 family)
MPDNPAPVTPPPVSMLVKLDKITLLLFWGTIGFALFLVLVDKLFPNDGQVFQVLASLTAGFSGAFFGRISPHPSTATTVPGASATPGALGLAPTVGVTEPPK